MVKIALGGGCHWCTEAVFQSINGVDKVEQGFVSSTGKQNEFSEAIIVHYQPITISLKTLIEIHLRTHKSTSEHSMRKKYRSAIYTFSDEQRKKAKAILKKLQPSFNEILITKVLPFNAFRPSLTQFHNYYYNNPEKPFCQSYIDSKIKLLLTQFREHTKPGLALHIKK
ncbi:peptide-methionine (S)-S-oxide reductase [Zobellia uliginosa]|uniref:peptide-methionine (S)-S-oxide reductase n=1 Tax=Zobellia uliginosa TaxID=143224 RepID=UPI001C06A7A9|nr:peptide-methionine (S)-S-oxide reductase [Zobellia uliginosa]MBU2948765.1 peptide-methionine (S)-S-oxide reductase [Zobellia uliginosa]